MHSFSEGSVTFSQGFQFSQDLFPPSSSTELMVVMKHLLHQQHAGRPGSPPGWKCHDRFPLVITVVFLQRLEGKQSHLATIRQPKLGLLAQASPTPWHASGPAVSPCHSTTHSRDAWCFQKPAKIPNCPSQQSPSLA